VRVTAVAPGHNGADLAERNGTARRTRKTEATHDEAPASKPARKPRSGGGRTTAAAKRDPLQTWAYAGVGLTLGLSGWLNGLAFSAAAPSPVHGWALGVSIPVAVLIFSRVSALCYGHGRRPLAYCGAVACLSILLLSVQHCAVSIAALTGEHVVLAGLMALAIDAGLVACELATVTPRR
jgi:hypothetical protein